MVKQSSLFITIIYLCYNVLKRKVRKMSLDVYLGIDVGSVTTKLALVDEKGKYVD